MSFLTQHSILKKFTCIWIVTAFLGLVIGMPAARAAPVRGDTTTSVDKVQPPIRKVQRTKDMETIQSVLERKAVRERLEDLGFTVQEVNTRLRRLSDEQIHEMAQRLESVTAGGHSSFPHPPAHGVLLVIFVILLPIVALVWLLTLPFHGHGHPHGGPPGHGPPGGVPPGHRK